MADDKELDLVEMIHNPLKQPDRAFMALAGAAMPVLLDRVGGSATFTLEEFEAVERRYGGRVTVKITRTKDGVFKAQLAAAQPKKNRSQA